MKENFTVPRRKSDLRSEHSHKIQSHVKFSKDSQHCKRCHKKVCFQPNSTYIQPPREKILKPLQVSGINILHEKKSQLVSFVKKSAPKNQQNPPRSIKFECEVKKNEASAVFLAKEIAPPSSSIYLAGEIILRSKGRNEGFEKHLERQCVFSKTI